MLQSMVTHKTEAGKTSENAHLKQTKTVNTRVKNCATRQTIYDLFKIEQLKLNINNVTKTVRISRQRHSHNNDVCRAARRETAPRFTLSPLNRRPDPALNH